jgi:hypothetical protein
MIGRRLADVVFGMLPDVELQAGDYWRYVNDDGEPLIAAGSLEQSIAKGNLTGGVWGIACPLGDGWAIGTLRLHTVREHDDGTISVLPGDGSSNSILVTRGDRSWHGYIYNGEWRPV